MVPPGSGDGASSIHDSSAAGRPSERLARWVQKHLLWLLLVAYALAAVLPGPGAALREAELAGPFWGDIFISVPLILLALLLFCAAVSTRLDGVRMVAQKPTVLILGLIGVWLGPTILVVVTALLFHRFVASGVLVGLVLVAAMPVANSSVGWTHNSRGNLALALALIVFSITLSPLVTPKLLQLLGFSLTAAEQAYCDLLVRKFSGKFFIVWVILPTACGFACRRLLGGKRIDRAGEYFRLTSALALLLLNYANSALVFPQMFEWSQLLAIFTTVAFAVALSLVGWCLADLITWLLRQPEEIRMALVYSLSMKHTGLALVLAGTVLQDQPRAILMIIVATVVQHIVAGVAQRQRPELA